jgi:hypothetical protein
MAVTHDMIAAKLSINRTTVTKALKGDASINAMTRKKVQETATLMGYDFKQSQQNRREGKRFFVKEKVKFTFLNYADDRPLGDAEGSLSNLSSTGLLIRISASENNLVPIGNIGVRLKVPDSSALSVVPRARIVRINYQPFIELAAKFEKEDQMSQDTLIDIERRSFTKIKTKS